ncbi:MAG: g-type lysozyme inhibitor [Pseudoxanthomonas sp.]
MKKITRAGSMSLLLAACFACTAWAEDKASTVPVIFARGASVATLKGSLAGYESVNYVLRAKAGQALTVKISGDRNANFNVFAPGDAPGSAAAIGRGSVGLDWSGATPTTGDYTIQVFQMRASARRAAKATYTVTTEIH